MNDYLFEKLRFLVELYGNDIPHAIKCLEKAARNREDLALYLRHFEKLLIEQGIPLGDPPVFGRLSEKDKRAMGIPIGRIVGAKSPEIFVLPFSVFEGRHVAVYGATGTGKSHLAKMAVKVLIEAGHVVQILDIADEYKDLCVFFDTDVFLAIDPKDLKINFLLPPPNVDRIVWRGIIVDIFRETMFLRDGACNELTSVLAALQKESMYPTFMALCDAILKKPYGGRTRRGQYVESLQNRSELLLNSYIGEALMCVKGHPLEQILIKRSAAIRIGLISDDVTRNFYVVYLLKWMETYLAYNPDMRETR
jgi:energy-coupling factor transporter ATP-binding protein EcfA2